MKIAAKSIRLLLICLLCFTSVTGEKSDFYFPEGPIRIIVPWGGNLNYVYLRTDVEPVNRGGYILASMRSVSDGLGGNISWDADGGIAALENCYGHSISVTIGSTQAVVDGESRQMPAAAEIIGGRTMVPLRFVAENLGWQVIWESLPWDNNHETLQCVWLTMVDFLKDSDVVPNPENYYTENEHDYGVWLLKPGGATARGIRLGDSAAQVVERYGRVHSAEESEEMESYLYSAKPYPNTDDVNVLRFDIQGGIVVKVTLNTSY